MVSLKSHADKDKLPVFLFQPVSPISASGLHSFNLNVRKI